MFASLLAASLGSSLGLCGNLTDAVIFVGLVIPRGSSPSSGVEVGRTMTDWVMIAPLERVGPGGPNGPRGPIGPTGSGCLDGSMIGVEEALVMPFPGLLRGS